MSNDIISQGVYTPVKLAGCGVNMDISLKDEILKLKKERNAVILAHYYQPGEIQELADYVGDSYYLSEKAKDCSEKVTKNNKKYT